MIYAGLIAALIAFANSAYATHDGADILHEVGTGGMPDFTTAITGEVQADAVYMHTISEFDADEGDTSWSINTAAILALPDSPHGTLTLNRLTRVATFTPVDTFAGDATFAIFGIGDSGGSNYRWDFTVTVTAAPPPTCTAPMVLNDAMDACVDPPEDMMPMPTVAARKSNDDKFDDFAIYSGVAILGSWAYAKYVAPGFSDKIKFTAKPTSNKSLQYSLSTNLNESWSANFTVNKSVKINSDTVNSNLYKVKFEYKF